MLNFNSYLCMCVYSVSGQSSISEHLYDVPPSEEEGQGNDEHIQVQ